MKVAPPAYSCRTLLLVLLAAWMAEGFNSGAPNFVCGTMRPVHPGTEQTYAPETFPFDIVLTSTRAMPGDLVTATVSGKKGGLYMGIMSTVIDAQGNRIPGFVVDDQQLQILNCTKGASEMPNTGVTHRERLFAATKTVHWQIPTQALVGTQYTIRFTVAIDIKTYWVAVGRSFTVGSALLSPVVPDLSVTGTNGGTAPVSSTNNTVAITTSGPATTSTTSTTVAATTASSAAGTTTTFSTTTRFPATTVESGASVGIGLNAGNAGSISNIESSTSTGSSTPTGINISTGSNTNAANSTITNTARTPNTGSAPNTGSSFSTRSSAQTGSDTSTSGARMTDIVTAASTTRVNTVNNNITSSTTSVNTVNNNITSSTTRVNTVNNNITSSTPSVNTVNNNITSSSANATGSAADKNGNAANDAGLGPVFFGLPFPDVTSNGPAFGFGLPVDFFGKRRPSGGASPTRRGNRSDRRERD